MPRTRVTMIRYYIAHFALAYVAWKIFNIVHPTFIVTTRFWGRTRENKATTL